MSGDKKPWRKVNKLEKRVEDLENVVERRYQHYVVDHEEMTKKIEDTAAVLDHKIRLEANFRERILKAIRETLENIENSGNRR